MNDTQPKHKIKGDPGQTAEWFDEIDLARQTVLQANFLPHFKNNIRNPQKQNLAIYRIN